jgi:hypothetical protein
MTRHCQHPDCNIVLLHKRQYCNLCGLQLCDQHIERHQCRARAPGELAREILQQFHQFHGDHMGTTAPSPDDAPPCKD